MLNLTYFYLGINVLVFLYVCYSWYWQAKLELRGKFRISVLIWTLIFIIFGFVWNYIERGNQQINIFLALIIVLSILDGFTGFAPTRMVVAGYFKRTLAYADITQVTLINVPMQKKPAVICLITTKNSQQYYLQFATDIKNLIAVLNQHIDHKFELQIRDIM